MLSNAILLLIYAPIGVMASTLGTNVPGVTDGHYDDQNSTETKVATYDLISALHTKYGVPTFYFNSSNGGSRAAHEIKWLHVEHLFGRPLVRPIPSASPLSPTGSDYDDFGDSSSSPHYEIHKCCTNASTITGLHAAPVEPSPSFITPATPNIVRPYWPAIIRDIRPILHRHTRPFERSTRSSRAYRHSIVPRAKSDGPVSPTIHPADPTIRFLAELALFLAYDTDGNVAIRMFAALHHFISNILYVIAVTTGLVSIPLIVAAAPALLTAQAAVNTSATAIYVACLSAPGSSVLCRAYSSSA